MNAYAAALSMLLSAWLLLAPRERAAVPLLLGAVWTTTGQTLEIGPAHFTALRILVLVGAVRVLSRGERLAGGLHTIDTLLIAWAAWLLGSAAFHADDSLVYRAGVAWNDLGWYLLLRVFLRDAGDVRRVFAAGCIALLPVGVLMGVEAATGSNAFAALGGVNVPVVRDGHLRASGPFGHAILAGGVGACCVAMALALWRTHRAVALCGLAAAAAMLLAARSSGPILMAGGIALGVALWRWRARMRRLQWLALAGCFGLAAVMQDPFYFVLARIDITGGSRGWHRAQLIRASIERLDEWWLVGTDRTRHWMGSGNYVNTAHTDITNHLLAQGVMGGLLLMALYGLAFVAGFRAVGRAVHNPAADAATARLAWLLGALLAGHAINFMNVSVFDQSAFFIQLALAAVCAVAVPLETFAQPAAVPAPRGIDEPDWTDAEPSWR